MQNVQCDYLASIARVSKDQAPPSGAHILVWVNRIQKSSACVHLLIDSVGIHSWALHWVLGLDPDLASRACDKEPKIPSLRLYGAVCSDSVDLGWGLDCISNKVPANVDTRICTPQ